VWLADGDMEAMARLRGTTVEAFTRDAVVLADDRLSLRERADGGCILLEGGDCCTVYEARPEQCRTFPYWDALLEDQARLAEAAAYCPGIQRFPDRATLAAVLPRVAALVDAAGTGSGATARAAADRDGHCERWGSSLEVDLCLARVRDAHPAPERAPELRAALQRLAAESGYPWSYAPWQRLRDDRAAGWRARGEWPLDPTP
jgi:hypothetical protein